jgi:hypothetical protein
MKKRVGLIHQCPKCVVDRHLFEWSGGDRSPEVLFKRRLAPGE